MTDRPESLDDEVEVTVTLPAGTWRVVLDGLEALGEGEDGEAPFLAREKVVERLREAHMRLTARMDQIQAEIEDEEGHDG